MTSVLVVKVINDKYRSFLMDLGNIQQFKQL